MARWVEVDIKLEQESHPKVWSSHPIMLVNNSLQLDQSFSIIDAIDRFIQLGMKRGGEFSVTLKLTPELRVGPK